MNRKFINGKFLNVTLSPFVFVAVLLAPVCFSAQVAKSRTIAVLVTLHVPAGLNRGLLEQGRAERGSTYQSAAGLFRKYFIVSEDFKVGRIRLSNDRQAAEAWNRKDPIFRAVAPKNTDLNADRTYCDAPTITNGRLDAARAGSVTPVVVVMEVPVPPGMDREKIEESMANSVPTFENAPGLLRKYFLFSDDQKFGGIYLWENQKAAEAWYTESVIWHNGVSKISGLRADLSYFEVPIVVDGPQSDSSNHP